MKNKIITFAASSAALAIMLTAGTASAHTLALGNGINIDAGVKATMQAHHPDYDNDNDDGKMYKGYKDTHATSTKPATAPLFVGTGQPVVGGTVTAVNGNTLTVVTATGVTYTVNAASSTVVKGNATTTASTIAVGSKVLVQGSVNGSSVTATSVVATQATSTTNMGLKHGWGFGSFKIFLHNLFGFF